MVQSQNNVLELLVQKSHDHFVLFVDPDTRLLYRYYLDGRNYVRIETLEGSEKDMQDKARLEKRVTEVLYKIRSLLVLP